MLELPEEIGKSIFIVGDFNNPLLITGRKRQKMSKYKKDEVNSPMKKRVKARQWRKKCMSPVPLGGNVWSL